MNAKALALIILGTLFLIFLLQNTHVTTVFFLFWHVSMSQIIFILLLISLGFLVGFVVGKKSW